MTGTYNVQPEGVTAIAEAIATQGDELGKFLEQSDFEGIMESSSGLGEDGVFVNGFQALVQQAVGNLIEDQVPKLERISNTIKSSVTAVVLNATVYFDADDATRQGVVDEAGASALSGDMTFFENIIEQHTEEQEAAAASAQQSPPPAPQQQTQYWQAPPAGATAATHSAGPVGPPAGISTAAPQAQMFVVNEDGTQVSLGEFLASRTSGAEEIGIHVPVDQMDATAAQLVDTATGAPGESTGTWTRGDLHAPAFDPAISRETPAGTDLPGEAGTSGDPGHEPGTTADGAPATGEGPMEGSVPAEQGRHAPDATEWSADRGVQEQAGSEEAAPDRTRRASLTVEPVRMVADRVPLTTAENDVIARQVGALLRGRLQWPT